MLQLKDVLGLLEVLEPMHPTVDELRAGLAGRGSPAPPSAADSTVCSP